MKNNLDVLIYTTKDCSYCKKAKLIFKKFKIKYNEIIVNNELGRIEMSRLSNGRKTVPQIFIKNKHIGGYDDLNYLKKSGKLDKFLN